LILAMTCQIYPIVKPGMLVRIFGRERWDLTQLRRHFGIVGSGTMGFELPENGPPSPPALTPSQPASSRHPLCGPILRSPGNACARR